MHFILSWLGSSKLLVVEESLKMKILILSCFNFFVMIVTGKCTVSYKPAKYCKFYRLDKACDLSIINNIEDNCFLIKVTRNEKKCPVYLCKVIVFFVYFYKGSLERGERYFL